MSYWATPSGWHPNTPMHVKEGHAGQWYRWFAWRPVQMSEPYGKLVWLKTIERRTFFPALWFVHIVPQWEEYREIPTPGQETRG